MGIDLTWEDEDGTQLESIPDPRNNFAHLVVRHSFSETSCLRFIDPYGDTTFNQLQIPVLIDELSSYRPLSADNQESEHIDLVLGLLRKAAASGHTYAKFTGD